MTQANASLGSLDPARLSRFSAEGIHVDGDKPIKEALLHQCMYCARKMSAAVVHLHSTHAVAVSILSDVALAEAVADRARLSHAVLLANYGPVVYANTLHEAQDAIAQLEETAKLHLLPFGKAIRPPTPTPTQKAALAI